MNSIFFRTDKLPYVELRYVSIINHCDRKHSHDVLTITAIVEGGMEIIFNDRVNYLRPKFLSVVNPKEAHYAKVVDVKSRQCYVLYLDISWCEELQKSLFLNTNNFIPLSSSLISDKQMYNSFLVLCKTLLSQKTLIEKEEEVITFCAELFIKYSNRDFYGEDSLLKRNDTVDNIQKYLDENFLSDLTLNDIAGITKLTAFHVLRLYKSRFGLTPHAYILNKKIHKAKELLKGDMPIADIAFECGFFDQSHLNKSFKKVFQVTPKEYRENLFY